MKLSIIIPCYNAEPYIKDLLKALEPQIRDDIEVVLVDDGSEKPLKTSYKWCKVIRKKNGGVATARNLGIEKTTGEYIAFIDSDDMVSGDYVEKILEKAKEGPDLIQLSWKSLTKDGYQFNYLLKSDSDRLETPSCWSRVLKRAFLGDIRFNERKDSTEDEDFSRKVGYIFPDAPIKEASVTSYVYFYRNVANSKIKRFKNGLMNSKRVVYYYKRVTREMQWLLEEIKKEDEVNEVWLLTQYNEIPELERYCQIHRPCNCWGHIIRGENYSGITKIEPPVKAQVVIYRRFMHYIGGLMTFTQNFVELMSDKYDITVVTERMNEERRHKLQEKANVVVTDGKVQVYCDTLIMLSFLDALPVNVHAKKIIRMCHACKTDPSWKIPHDGDETVYVSATAMKSHGVKDGKVIHNANFPVKDRALILVSATRLPAADKGDNEKRFRILADKLNEKGIKYIWLNFADGALPNPPKNFYNMGVNYDMQSVIASADYVVQLSDSECWSYTCLESLMLNKPLICTPFPSVFEMGVKDGVNAHVIPFDMDFDVAKLLEIPKFEYKYDNARIKRQWMKILNTKPSGKRQQVQVVVTVPYKDMVLDREMEIGEKLKMDIARAEHVQQIGYIKILKE